MAKWQLAFVAAFVVIFGLTVVLTGNPTYVIAAVMIAALVLGWAVLNRVMTKRVESRHDSIEDAMSDESEPLPSSHLIPDNRTAAGDTPEAHDEINPHDLPPDHPGRQAAEHQAAEERGGGRARGLRRGARAATSARRRRRPAAPGCGAAAPGRRRAPGPGRSR